MKCKNEIIILFLNLVTILACLNYTIYETFVNYLVAIDTSCMLAILFTNFKINKRFLIYLIILLIVAVFSCIINGGGIGSLFVLLNFVLLVYTSTFVIISQKWVKLFSVLYILLLLYWSFFGELSLYNPNTIGIIALMGVCFGIIYSSTLKSKKIAVVFVAVILLVSYQLETEISQSRTCFICGILLTLIVYFLPAKIFSAKPIYWSICIVLTIGSLFWTRLYVYLYKNSIDITLGFSTKNFFSGREAIWIEMWRELESKWITGVGTGYSMNAIVSKGFNVHNSIFNFLVVYGIIVFVLLMVLIFYKFKDQFNKIEFKKLDLSFIAMGCIFIIFIHAFSETTLISSLFYGPIFTIFCLVNSGSRNEQQEQLRK